MTTYIVLGGLFVFGFGYNVLIHWLESHAFHEGIIPILVVVWVFITGVGFGFLRGGEEAKWVLGCFFISGFWLVMGSYYRYFQEVKQRREDAKLHSEWCWECSRHHKVSHHVNTKRGMVTGQQREE